MKLLLVTLRKRAGSDEVSRRETLLQGDEIRIGRAVSSEITLSEIDVDAHHATLRMGGDGTLTLTAETDGGLVVNHERVRAAAMTPDRIVSIGRYAFRAEPGRDGADAVLVMEETPGATGSAGRSPVRRELDDVLPSRRMLGWVGALAVLVVFLAWPLWDVLQRPGMQADAGPAEARLVSGMARSDLPHPTPMEATWTSGPLSAVHAMLGDDCAACHERPFVRVQDNSCLACHATIEDHADPVAHPAIAAGAMRCAWCHLEHEGGGGPTSFGPLTCGGCHSDIRASSAESQLDNTSSFATQHPVFQLAVITGVEQGEDGRPEPIVVRTRFSRDNLPNENTGLKFSHAKHLASGGIKAPGGGMQQLQCADCHQAEAGGRLMRPIQMERDCGGCHRMEFNAAGVRRPLLHAEEDEVARVITDYFLAAAMQGGVTTDGAPDAAKRLRRKLPNPEELALEQAETDAAFAQLSDAERGRIIQWARRETVAQMDDLFGNRLCGTCHEAEKFPDRFGIDRWKVLPAVLQRHWMPKARFNHTPHLAMDCGGCHAAVASDKASDVLMPDIETCRDCHVEGTRTAGIGCISCHEYHGTGRTPMSPEHAQMFRIRNDALQRAPKP